MDCSYIGSVMDIYDRAMRHYVAALDALYPPPRIITSDRTTFTEADARALAGDWQVVGDDLHRAMRAERKRQRGRKS